MTVKINKRVFNEAVEMLDGQGYLFDREQAAAEIAWADSEHDDWQATVDGWDATAMAEFLVGWMELTDEANRAATDAAAEDAEAEYA